MHIAFSLVLNAILHQSIDITFTIVPHHLGQFPGNTVSPPFLSPPPVSEFRKFTNRNHAGQGTVISSMVLFTSFISQSRPPAIPYSCPHLSYRFAPCLGTPFRPYYISHSYCVLSSCMVFSDHSLVAWVSPAYTIIHANTTDVLMHPEVY
ncbi:hypothetical protein AZE42_08557 [Rhizopogon vesiculosus]|uniref:Uncharacterized protein n=1 Tax=Rhizopogon vesiculosus TaxID=180088 RepID=A0A1J8QI57_9AGAM|nr:hypothetical protein AZE42_08557 [Rhizopogon vesiculosus]